MTEYAFDQRIDLNTIRLTSVRHHAPAAFVERSVELGVLACLMLLTGCGSVTLFQSSFNPSAIGAPPSHSQSTGTIDVSGAPGSVVIVSAPPNSTGNWAQIRRAADATAPISTMQCNLSQLPQDGSYSLAASLFIPSGSGLATVEFDTSGSASPASVGFLHLDFGDFPQNNPPLKNTVRLNDTGPFFGTFPRDHVFSIAVSLEISSSSATAHINLFGTGASGTQDLNIVNNVTPLTLPRQFGEVKFYMGSPWNGSFDVTDILVTRKR